MCLRYVLIKYSMRGIAVNGKIPPLFNQLYALISVTFYVLFLSLYLLVYLLPRYDQFSKTLLQQFRMEEDKKSFSFLKYQETHISFSLTFLTLLIFMILAIIYTLRKSKIKEQNQRYNVYTFFLTVFWGLIHISIILTFLLAMMKKMYLVLNFLRFVMILISHFLKPIITIIEVERNFPEFFMDNMTLPTRPRDFYFNQTNLSPRQEPLMPLIPFKQNAR